MVDYRQDPIIRVDQYLRYNGDADVTRIGEAISRDFRGDIFEIFVSRYF